MIDENSVENIETTIIPISKRKVLSASEIDQLPDLLSFLRKPDKLKLKIGGLPVRIHEVLGKGGSKTVYDIGTDAGRYALALPNSVDEPIVVREKWRKVLREPANAVSVRKLGLCTNTLCVTLPVSINGVGFLGLLMRRYVDLPYEVVDSKNRLSSTSSGLIIPDGGLEAKTFIPFFSSVVEDCATLLRNGMLLGSDCFSFCQDRSQARPFFNDLGAGMEVVKEKFSETDIRHYSREYVRSSMNAWASQFHFNYFDRNEIFYRQFNNHKDSDQTSIASKLVEQIVNKL